MQSAANDMPDVQQPAQNSKPGVRPDIAQQVEECLRELKKAAAAATNAQHNQQHSQDEHIQRCVVCTLPHGTCSHTVAWLNEQSLHGQKLPKSELLVKPLPRDDVALALDDIDDVCTDPRYNKATYASYSAAAAASQQHSASVCRNVHWTEVDVQCNDLIEGYKADASSPSGRCGHTMVRLGGLPGNDAADDESNVFVVFGGMSWQNSNGICNLFSPLDSKPTVDGNAAAQPLKAVYHNSTHVHKVSTSTWHKPHITGHVPSARYGHVAVALNRDTMWVHGGRCADGTYSRDSYLLHIGSLQWECVSTPLLHKTAAYANATLTAASPSARMYSSAVHVPHSNRVVLCGGVNNVTGACYSDVWFWNTVTHEWTEQIVTGLPPAARFGHSMLLCGEQGRILVLGGCCVSAVQEIARPKDWDKTELQLRLAAEEVHR
jgi:Galactose oxidase, central domain